MSAKPAKKRRHLRTSQRKQLAKLSRPERAHRSGKQELGDAFLGAMAKLLTHLMDAYIPGAAEFKPDAVKVKPAGLLNDSKTIDLVPERDFWKEQ